MIHQWFNAFQAPTGEELALYDSPLGVEGGED